VEVNNYKSTKANNNLGQSKRRGRGEGRQEGHNRRGNGDVRGRERGNFSVCWETGVSEGRSGGVFRGCPDDLVGKRGKDMGSGAKSHVDPRWRRGEADGEV